MGEAENPWPTRGRNCRGHCARGTFPVGLPFLGLPTSIQGASPGWCLSRGPASLAVPRPTVGKHWGVWPLLVFVETAGGRNMVLGWSDLRVTHFGSFETSFHLRRLQQHGGEVALFTEDLWLRGWSCCGQCDWLSLWQGGAWAVMRSHGVQRP